MRPAVLLVFVLFIAFFASSVPAQEGRAALEAALKEAETKLHQAIEDKENAQRRLREIEAALAKAGKSKAPQAQVQKLEKELKQRQQDLQEATSRVTRWNNRGTSLTISLAKLGPPKKPPVVMPPVVARPPPPPPPPVVKKPQGPSQVAAAKPAPQFASPPPKPDAQPLQAPPLPKLPMVETWPRLDFVSTQPEVLNVFLGRQAIASQRRLLAWQNPTWIKPPSAFQFEKMIATGIAQEGRPPRPTLPDLPVALGARATVVYAAAADPNAQSPVLQLQSTGTPLQILELRLNRPFYQQGFPEVGVLARGSEVICTAALIHPGWILTAAHCITEFVGDELRYIRSDVGFYLVSADAPGAYAIDVQGRAILQRAMVRQVFFSGATVPNSWKARPEDDVALLRVAPEQPQVTTAEALLMPGTTLRDRVEVTIAAFGHVTGGGGASAGRLEVGWHEIDFATLGSTIFSWEYAGEGNFFSACPMDSGAPIYRGMQQGYPDEKRELIGILSRRKNAPISAADWQRGNACSVGEAIHVRLDTPAMRGFLCRTTENALNGCL